MKKLFAVLVLLVFAVACAPSSDNVEDLADIKSIEMFQQNDASSEEVIARKALLEEWQLLETEAGKTYIFNALESHQVEEDGIMYMYEVDFPNNGKGYVPCLKIMYKYAEGDEILVEKSLDLFSYTKTGEYGVIYHKEVFYKDVSTTSMGKKLATLQ